MTYSINHARTWLLEHPFISIGKLEMAVGCPKGTIRHFVKERRDLPSMYMETMTTLLSDYGYESMGSE